MKNPRFNGKEKEKGKKKNLPGESRSEKETKEKEDEKKTWVVWRKRWRRRVVRGENENKNNLIVICIFNFM